MSSPKPYGHNDFTCIPEWKHTSCKKVETFTRHYFGNSRAGWHRLAFIPLHVWHWRMNPPLHFPWSPNVSELPYSALASPSHYHPSCVARSKSCLFLNHVREFYCKKDGTNHLKLTSTVKTLHWEIFYPLFFKIPVLISHAQQGSLTHLLLHTRRVSQISSRTKVQTTDFKCLYIGTECHCTSWWLRLSMDICVRFCRSRLTACVYRAPTLQHQNLTRLLYSTVPGRS